MKNHLLVCGFCLSVLAIGLASPMPLKAATIKSNDIFAADNTTGQVITTGKGVKTDHIQNLAVTSAKIATATILTGNIAASQITNALLATNAVTVDKIQDGAVTDAKVFGPISASKISFNGLNADTVDGVHASAFAMKYGKVAVVAQSGGDYSDPASALDSVALAQWCGTPSSSNPCLLKIMPGIYNVGAQLIQLPAFVDIEGSGEGTTTITGSAAALISMSSSELRSLSVEVVVYDPTYQGIVVNGGSAKFKDFTYKSRGYMGMYTVDAELTMSNVTFLLDGVDGVVAIGLLIENSAGNPAADLDNVRIHFVNGGGAGIGAFYGPANIVFRNGKIDGGYTGIRTGGMTIRNSEIRGTENGIEGSGMTIVGSIISGGNSSLLNANASNTKVSFSELIGPIVYGSGLKCFNVHDENYNAVTCP